MGNVRPKETRRKEEDKSGFGGQKILETKWKGLGQCSEKQKNSTISMVDGAVRI